MLSAALMGLEMPARDRAKFRRRRKKFTAMARGTTPVRMGWLTARPMITIR